MAPIFLKFKAPCTSWAAKPRSKGLTDQWLESNKDHRINAISVKTSSKQAKTSLDYRWIFKFQLYIPLESRDRTLEGTTNQNEVFLEKRHSDWILLKNSALWLVVPSRVRFLLEGKYSANRPFGWCNGFDNIYHFRWARTKLHRKKAWLPTEWADRSSTREKAREKCHKLRSKFMKFTFCLQLCCLRVRWIKITLYAIIKLYEQDEMLHKLYRVSG